MELGPIGTSIPTINQKAQDTTNVNGKFPQPTTMVYDTESLTTGFNELSDQAETRSGQQTETPESTPAPSAVANHQSKQISEFDAIQHLIKGNLGPGCLNIPHAFAMSGWVLGLFLFVLVAIQGIYSMVLLVYCKQWIRAHKKEKQRLTRDQGMDENEENRDTSFEDDEIVTFMDVAYATHGRLGSVCVQILLFVLQAGVCCVFLSLIATNLHASIPSWDSELCVFLVTFLLLLVVLVRDLKELKWLSLGANCLMVTAIVTASVSALWVLFADSNGDNDDNDNDDNEKQQAKKWTANPAAIAAFVSSMFYSFEGIGLVMPVENVFVGYNKRSSDETQSISGSSEGEQTQEELRIAERTTRFVNPVLIGAMSTVAGLFLLIGATCGPAFPDIHDGSVTAYLTTKYPNSLWYQIVNAGVMVAVFLTFPLQLTPAMEVLGDWFGPGCDPVCCSGPSSNESTSSCCLGGGGLSVRRRRRAGTRQGGRHAIVAQSDEQEGFHDEGEVGEDEVVIPGDGILTSPPLPPTNSCFGDHEWIFRRYLVVFGCALVVLTVNDLGLLMSLFGALGNTGLAAMPCIIHWRLVQQGIAPLNFLLLAVDVATIGVSLGVAIIGVAFSVKEILEK